MATTQNSEESGVSCEAILNGLHLLTNAGIFSTDVHLNITSWNHWLEANSGTSAHVVIGRSLLEVFPELAERRLDLLYQQAVRGQVIVLSQPLHGYLLQLPPSTDDGNRAYMPQSARIAPLIDGGTVVGTVTLIEDVTERVIRDAELALRARQQAAIASLSHEALASRSLETLFQKAASIVAQTLDVEYCAIFELGATAIQLKAGVGWPEGAVGTAEDAGPGSYAELVLQNARPTLIEDLAQENRFQPSGLLRKAGMASGISVPIICNGRPCGLLGVYMNQRWSQSDESLDFLQAAVNVLGTAIERDGLERNLRERAQELMIADRRKNEFLAMLAHELRNPLAPIRNAIEILFVNGVGPDDLHRARDVVDRQVQQMTRLVDDLLDVSRITRGKIQFQPEVIDLAEAINRALEISRHWIDTHRHQLNVELPSTPMPVWGDMTRLAQAIANLINNAAKYTDPGGKISIVAEPLENIYRIRIQDNGVGIAPDMLPQIFDLFTQVDNSLARSEGGLGIGLTLVRTLVEMHGGSVRALSAGRGQGSEFVIELPKLTEPLETRRAKTTPNLPERSANVQRILVVDDNVDAADTLALLLQAIGHETQSVHSGPAALEAVRRFKPNIVFLDIGLPGMDGFAVARRMREEYAEHPLTVIALSGYVENLDDSKAAGFDLHLVKPIDLHVLRRILADLPVG